MIAPDHLEPYAARVAVTAGEPIEDVGALVVSLLEETARLAEEAGSSLIGHVKCHARVGDARFHCNLTSRRSGARCQGQPAAMAGGESLTLDLVVLVYGLARAEIAAAALSALGTTFPNERASWRLHEPREHDHEHGDAHSPRRDDAHNHEHPGERPGRDRSSHHHRGDA